MDNTDDREVSVSGKLTESGVSAKIISRTVSSIDRLIGSLVGLPTVYVERKLEIEEAKTRAAVAFVDAVGQVAAANVSKERALVDRAVEQYAKLIVRKQENLEAVVQEAVSQIAAEPRLSPGKPEEPEVLEEPFLDRFESYASGASSDELRLRWGRVLAAEVLKPGTFSQKVLRIVDELDSETAKMFEEISAHAVDGVIPKLLSGQITYEQEAALSTAGLLLDDGFGLTKELVLAESEAGHRIWNLYGDEYALGIIVEDIYVNAGHGLENENLHSKSGSLRLPVYGLTSAGKALLSILPIDEYATLRELGEAIHGRIPQASLRLYKLDRAVNRAVAIETIYDAEENNK